MDTGFFRGRGPAGCLHRNTVIFEYKAVLRPVVELGAGQDNGIAAADYIARDFAIYTGAAVNDWCAQCLLILPNHGIPQTQLFPIMTPPQTMASSCTVASPITVAFLPT